MTQVCRDPHSAAYGSFDRDWWHYRIRDFSSVILQQGAYAIWLAAHDLGLGACWVNPTIQFGIKRILGIPFNKKLVSVIAIGYPNETPVHTRKKLADFVFFEKHGNKKGPIEFKE